MSPELIALIACGAMLAALVLFFIYRKIPKRLKSDNFAKQWKDLQTLCKDRKTWPEALTKADNLLDKALKKRKFKGKTMGERMVSAQKVFTDNDGIWFAHNLYKKIASEELSRLKEIDVKEALIAYRQALRDVGALKSEQTKNK